MLYSSLKRNKKQNADKVAIICNNISYSYSDLWLDTKKLAHWFNTNLESQAKVGIILDNSYEAVIVIYGIILSNRICVPLDSDMHERNIKYIVNDTSISSIFTSSKYLDKVEGINSENFFNTSKIKEPKNKAKKY